MVRITVRPLRNELARPSESVRDLKYEFPLAELDDKPINEVRVTERPLDLEPARLKELLRVLSSERC